MRVYLALCVAALGTGCQTTTCDATDFDCVMEHLSIRVGDNEGAWTRIEKNRLPAMPSSGSGGDGFDLQLIPLSVPNWGDPIELLQSGMVGVSGGGGGTAAPAPSLDSPSVNVSLDSPTDEQTVMVSFTDPNGEVPGICFQAIDPKGLTGPYAICDRPKRDLQPFGIVPIRIRFNAYVDHSTINFGTASMIQPSPIVPTPIVTSPLQTLPPLPPTVGVPVRWPFVPPAPPTNGASPPADDPTKVGGFSECRVVPFQCSDTSTCTELRVCASGGPTGCEGGYVTLPDKRPFPCDGCGNCTNAAMAAVSHCCPPPK
jgi:hypothetical protein